MEPVRLCRTSKRWSVVSMPRINLIGSFYSCSYVLTYGRLPIFILIIQRCAFCRHTRSSFSLVQLFLMSSVRAQLPTGEYVPLRDGESPPPGARMEPSVQSLNDIPDPTKLKVPDITMVRSRGDSSSI